MARFGLGHGHANALALLPGLRRLLDLPTAPALLHQIGMSAPELTTRVAALTGPAVCQPASAIAMSLLNKADDRRALLDAIAADPCLRTCPLPAAALDLEALLDEVGDGVTQRC
jgi:hypothetical protein